MVGRRLLEILRVRLSEEPAVVLLGPRQAGKTTLAFETAQNTPSIYLDLESNVDRAKLQSPHLYLSANSDKLLILDEVHRMPELFQTLRGVIDQGRRDGKTSGQFLLLGSASLDLIRQSGESLAGRVSYLELGPIDAGEVGNDEVERLWIRGGFPNSFLAATDSRSFRWRLDFIRSYLERDVPQLGPRIAAETLRRFWTMLAHYQGSPFNAAQIARALGLDGKTVATYLDLMVDLLLVRRLSPWHRNEGKRLVRSPKVYVRDSGLVHALLGLKDGEAVFGHPVAGQSWEGFAIESLVAAAPEGTLASYYRTAAGAEIDLLLEFPAGGLWAIEIKRNLVPKVERGFHEASLDLKPDRRFIVYPGAERYPVREGVEAIPLREMVGEFVT